MIIFRRSVQRISLRWKDKRDAVTRRTDTLPGIRVRRKKKKKEKSSKKLHQSARMSRTLFKSWKRDSQHRSKTMGKNSSTFAPSLLARRRNAVFPPPYPLIDTTSELENRKYIANNVLIASFNLRSSFETRFEILSYLYFNLLLLRKSFIFERKKKKVKGSDLTHHSMLLYPRRQQWRALNAPIFAYSVVTTSFVNLRPPGGKLSNLCIEQ